MSKPADGSLPGAEMGAEPPAFVRIFSDEARAKIFGAVALGARTSTRVIELTGLPARAVAEALQRLSGWGVLTQRTDGFTVDYESSGRTLDRRPRRHATGRNWRRTRRAGSRWPGPSSRTGICAACRPGGSGRRTSWPTSAPTHFEAGRYYSELEVNEILVPLCEGGETDHATIRRYLVDLHFLHRRDGRYWRPAPELGLGRPDS